MGSDEIASGIQNISDALRSGFGNAANQLFETMENVEQMVQESGEPMEAVLKRLRDDDSAFAPAMAAFSGTCFSAAFATSPGIPDCRADCSKTCPTSRARMMSSTR